MTPLNALTRRHRRPSRLHSPHVDRSGVVWWCAVVLTCALVWSVQEHRHVLVRAQFAANPLTLNPTNTLVLNGTSMSESSGTSISAVGDVNGDDVDDFVVGAPFAGVTAAGQVYLLFGRNASTPWTPGSFDLSALDGTTGVTLNGVVAGHRIGWRVSGVKDVNGDGIHDILIGTQLGNMAYVVFGVNGTWPGALNLTQGAFNGVTFNGKSSDDTGYSVNGAGDVNNDGIHDFIIGSRTADTPGGSQAGLVNVLYGRPSSSPWPAVVDLTTYVNASTGFSVLGVMAMEFCGEFVSGVGDVNGDGVDDVAFSCSHASPPGVDGAGVVAVVFGSSSPFPIAIERSALNGTNGFVVNGQGAEHFIGTVVASVGDVNADGLDDFAIGAPDAQANALTNSGIMHVLFGRNASASPWPSQVNVSSLDGNNGFTLAGSEMFDVVGHSVSAVGDVNDDGIDDFLVGADGAGALNRGLAFLLYGRAVWPAMQNTSYLDVSMSVTFEGSTNSGRCGRSVSHVGDVNGDGRGDLAIGCPFVGVGGNTQAGQTAVVFGPSFTSAPSTAAPTVIITGNPTTASPTTASPTTSPTASTCASQGAFIPPGATCVNGVLVTTTNTTVPTGTTSTVATSVTITGGASFEQPSGSTLVFVVGGGGSGGGSGSTSISVQGGGCANIGGDAVVNFEADPSNGGADGNTGALVLVMADCVMGSFGSVSATTAFEGDECVAIGDGDQQSSGSSISVSFAVSDTCSRNSSGLSTGALIGIIVGGSLVTVVIVIVLVKLAARARNRRAEGDVKMSHMKSRGR